MPGIKSVLINELRPGTLLFYEKVSLFVVSTVHDRGDVHITYLVMRPDRALELKSGTLYVNQFFWHANEVVQP